ncbi:MAG: hypothetical protein F6K09_09895, partial [Merismopedia sp. SIO2A8]|nr:hypothetical protein [Merismopedia sp. SIO2A8]
MTIFFTTEIDSRYIGISDILTRLYKIYRLGIALSYTYRHKPFFCRRSLPNSTLDRLIRKISGFNEERVSDFNRENDLFVAKFLGLSDSENGTDDINIDSEGEILTINIADLLGSESFQNIDELKAKIESSMPSLDAVTLNFLVTKKIYDDNVSANLETLLGSTNLTGCHLDQG